VFGNFEEKKGKNGKNGKNLIINYFFSKKNKSSKNISSPFFLTTRTSVFSSSFLFFLPLSLLLGC